MSKKADKKQQKAKVPEVTQDSPERQEEVARKQREAYDMIQRAIIRSQVRGQRHDSTVSSRFSVQDHVALRL